MCLIKWVILTRGWMLRTPVSIVLTNSARPLTLAKCHFPLQDDPMTHVHKVWSWSLGGLRVILTGHLSLMDGWSLSQPKSLGF